MSFELCRLTGRLFALLPGRLLVSWPLLLPALLACDEEEPMERLTALGLVIFGVLLVDLEGLALALLALLLLLSFFS